MERDKVERSPTRGATNRGARLFKVNKTWRRSGIALTREWNHRGGHRDQKKSQIKENHRDRRRTRVVETANRRRISGTTQIRWRERLRDGVDAKKKSTTSSQGVQSLHPKKPRNLPSAKSSFRSGPIPKKRPGKKKKNKKHPKKNARV